MNFHTRKHTTAWLGLFAMWLIVFVPLVSQFVISHRATQPETILCSAHISGPEIQKSPNADPLVACGYCDLLATHVAMPPVPAVTLVLLTLFFAAVSPSLNTRFTPLGAFPSGRPRAPPLAC